MAPARSTSLSLDPTTRRDEHRLEPSPAVDRLLSDSRRGWHRLPVHLAALAIASGGLLVDIRPEAQRQAEGEPLGGISVERNVLEWRLDPTSPDRLPMVTDHDLVVILICSQGYASSLAVASLHQLGLHRATDIIGGFEAWRAAGLPSRFQPAEPADARPVAPTSHRP
jgi:rhodanese-related sulfurtransferase